MLSEQNITKERGKGNKVKKLLNAFPRHLNIHVQIRTLGHVLNNLYTWIVQLSGLQRPS